MQLLYRFGQTLYNGTVETWMMGHSKFQLRFQGPSDHRLEIELLIWCRGWQHVMFVEVVEPLRTGQDDYLIHTEKWNKMQEEAAHNLLNNIAIKFADGAD